MEGRRPKRDRGEGMEDPRMGRERETEVRKWKAHAERWEEEMERPRTWGEREISEEMEEPRTKRDRWWWGGVEGPRTGRNRR